MANSKDGKTGLFSNLKGDLFGGLTAGIVALPLALAFGVQSGLGAAAGLFGAIFIGFFASLFGGTSSQISGPTAPMTAVSMLIIAGIVQANDGHMETALPIILLVFLLAGIFQIIFGVIKLGGLIEYIPYPVVSGFMTGIGVIILVTQLLPLFGYVPADDQANIDKFKPQAEEVLLDKILKDEADEGLLVLEDFRETVKRAENTEPSEILLEAKTLVSKDASGVIGALRYLPEALKNINWWEFMVAMLTIVIIFGFKRITKAVPSTLVALLTVSLVAIFAGWEVEPIGTIPSGFPKLYVTSMISGFSFSALQPYIFTAISLALLGAIDSLLTSIVADNMTKTKHNSDKELIGQGIGNSIAAVFGGIPGAGATIRTVVNIDSGGKTKLSGMIAASLLLVILLILGPYASQIPLAVLAGILITVGIGVMDYKGLRALRSMPRTDALVLITVLLLTVFWDLIFAVAIGLVLSSLMFMKKMGDLTGKESTVSPLDESLMNSSRDDIPVNLREEVFVKDVNGPLFFGATSEYQKLASQIPNTASTVVIKMDRVPYMDKSGFLAMEDVILSFTQKGIATVITGLQEQPAYLLETFGLIPDLIPKSQVFENFADCSQWLIENVEDKYPSKENN